LFWLLSFSSLTNAANDPQLTLTVFAPTANVSSQLLSLLKRLKGFWLS
jgi:uncharacterized surface protein with fasciclin (FAS1) repeats